MISLLVGAAELPTAAPAEPVLEEKVGSTELTSSFQEEEEEKGA